MLYRHTPSFTNTELPLERRGLRFRVCTAVVLLASCLALLLGCGDSEHNRAPDTDERAAYDRTLQVMLIPADTGADSTLDDFRPIFNAVSRHHGLEFDLKVGTSYASVVQGMANGQVDIAFLGPVSLYQAQQRDAAELLGVAVKEGESTYHSVILARNGQGIQEVRDLQDRSIALGDVQSTSSFRYPLAMMLRAGIDPINDLDRIVLAGSHSNAIAALREGHVDAAGCSLNAYEKAVRAGVIDREDFHVVAVSPGIPNPPLAMHPGLPDEVKQLLRKAFGTIHEAEGVSPSMIRGYGGARYDRYDVDFPQQRFDEAMADLSPVTQELIDAILEDAAGSTSSADPGPRYGSDHPVNVRLRSASR